MANKPNLVNIYSSITSSRIVFVITCILTAALLIDTSLARISNFVTSNAQGSPLISIFTIIGIIYIVGQYIILEYTKKKINEINRKNMLSNVLSKILRGFQYSISVFLIVVIFEIFVNSNYHTLALTIVVMISYGLSIVTLGILGKHFFSWFRSRKSYVVLFYALSSSIFVASAIFSVLFVFDITIKLPKVIQFHYSNFPYFYGPGSLSFYLYNGYVISSILSFVLIWLATAMFLYHYSKKLGKTKYWIIMSLPLVYFLGQFASLFLNIFDPFMRESPVFFGVLLSVIFPISKAVGGILFGIGFWITSRTINKSNIVRHYLVITAMGFILLFVSDQAVTLIATPYPPFGLASVSTVGLSSYLILVGLYYSAISVSDDAKLRRTIREAALRESKFLDSIGKAYMGQEIESKVLGVAKELKDTLAKETGVSTSLTDVEIKQYLKEVLTEVRKGKAQSGDK
jgi:hypothetical protein